MINLLERYKHSIRFRLWVLLVAMSMIILAMSAVLFGVYGWKLQRSQFEAQLLAMGNLIAQNSVATLSFDDADTAREDATKAMQHEALKYVGIFYADGSIFASSGEGSERCPPPAASQHRPEVHYHDPERMCVDMPVVSSGRLLGIVRLERDLSPIRRQIVIVAGGAVGVFLLTLLVAMVLAARIGRSITDPVTRLAGMVDQVTDRGRIDTRAFVSAQDEVGLLARGINSMLDNLEASRLALERSLSLQRTLFNTIPMPVYGKNAERVFTAMNRRFARDVIGLEPDAILGRTHEEVTGCFEPEEIAAIRKREHELLREGRDEPFEITGRDADGAPRIYLVQLGLYRDEGGRIAGFMGIMQDITEMRRIGKELVDVSMREQQRLARDLHDNLGQLLTATACKIKALEYETDEAALKASLGEVIALINRSAREARALSHGLNPVDVERGGLENALEELAASTEVYARLTCRFTAANNLPELDKDASNQLYRIAQEAVNNAVRHAGASRIDIVLARDGGDIVLTVRDNGSGMPARREGSASGMGLRIMNQRALMIHGELYCQARSGGGTDVICRCPANVNEA